MYVKKARFEIWHTVILARYDSVGLSFDNLTLSLMKYSRLVTIYLSTDRIKHKTTVFHQRSRANDKGAPLYLGVAWIVLPKG